LHKQVNEAEARAKKAEDDLAFRIQHEAVTPNLDVQRYENRITELMNCARLWLRDHPNQILRDMRKLPNDESALQKTLYALLNEDGSPRGLV
jgi:hypothetical protein